MRSPLPRGPETGPSTSPARRVVVATAGVIASVDALAKVVAVAALEGRPPVALPLGLGRLRIYRNPGGPGGFLDSHTLVVTGASTAVLAAVWVASRQATSRAEALGFGLLMGGGLGNLADRVVRTPGPLQGHVVDWLQPWYAHSVMNLADLALQAGLVVLAGSAASTWWRTRGPLARAAQSG